MNINTFLTNLSGKKHMHVKAYTEKTAFFDILGQHLWETPQTFLKL